MKEFIAQHKKELQLSIIVCLLCVISFALGYITARDLSAPPIIIQTCQPES